MRFAVMICLFSSALYATSAESQIIMVEELDEKHCDTQDTPQQDEIVFSGVPVQESRKDATLFHVRHVFKGPCASAVLINHPVNNFYFFAGEHILQARLGEGGYFVTGTKHGEVISDAELERRADAKRRREDDGHSVERELCYQIIKQAYDAQDLTGQVFKLEDPNCKVHKTQFDKLYRLKYRVKIVPDLP